MIISFRFDKSSNEGSEGRRFSYQNSLFLALASWTSEVEKCSRLGFAFYTFVMVQRSGIRVSTHI